MTRFLSRAAAHKQISIRCTPAFALAAVAVFMSASPATQAATSIIKIDFNTTSSPTETGWEPFNIAGTNTQEETYATSPVFSTGNVKLSLAGIFGLDSADSSSITDSGSLTLAEMYRDHVRASRSLDMTFSGLIPGQEYSTTFYSYDPTVSSGATITVQFGTGQFGRIVLDDELIADGQYSVTLTGAADSDGELRFYVLGEDGPARVNGVNLASTSAVPIPEPATSMAGLLITGVLAFHRHRQRARA
jgi:hypothetical protein